MEYNSFVRMVLATN